VQIQAYLDNVFDVGALLEDAEAKSALLEHLEELQEHNALVDVLLTHTHTHTRAHAHWTRNAWPSSAAELQASGAREAGDGERVGHGEEAHPDHEGGGAPQGRGPASKSICI